MWTEGLMEAEGHFEDFRLRESRYGLHYTEAAFLRALLVGDSKSRAVALARLAESEESAEADLRGLETWAEQMLAAKLNSTTKAQALQLVMVGQRVRLAVAVYAETQMCRSGCHILHEAYIKGSLAFRTAWKQYQRCQRLGEAQRLLERNFLTPEEQATHVNPQLEADITSLSKFGLGVLSLSLSMAPQKVVRLAKLAVGMEADQTQGLKFLYECMRIPGGIRVPLSLMFVLFWLLIYIPDFISGKNDRYREAAELIQLGRSLLPKSAFFYWLESYLQEKQGYLNQAQVLLEKATRVCRKLGFPQTPPRLAFEKGWLCFLCQNWPLSARYLEESLKDVEATPLPLLLLGVSCCMLGNGPSAEQWFRRLLTPEMERNYTERWISTRARRYLERKCYPLFPLEVIYLTDYMNCMGRDWHENALLFFEGVTLEVPQLPKTKSFFSLSRPSDEESDEYVIYLLLKGAVCRHLGRLREAVKALELAVQYHDSAQKETFAVPHAYYELGMVLVKGRDWEAAEQMLLKAKTFRRFDFRKSLIFKVDAALEVLAAEQIEEARR
jgi:tetratricopeptide (TPR) repeat protein